MKELFLCGAGNPEGVRLAIRINERERRWSRIVLLDDDRGKQGRVLGIDRARGKVRVEKVRMQKRHLKPGRKALKTGGVLDQEGATRTGS